MDIIQEANFEEKKLNRFAKAAFLLHGISVAILACINSKDSIKVLAIAVMITTFSLSGFYIRQRKKVETLKTYSDQETSVRNREFAALFLGIYPLWTMILYMQFR